MKVAVEVFETAQLDGSCWKELHAVLAFLLHVLVLVVGPVIQFVMDIIYFMIGRTNVHF